jgi:hypothetical protein
MQFAPNHLCLWKLPVFWNMMPCILVFNYQLFVSACYHHIQGGVFDTLGEYQGNECLWNVFMYIPIYTLSNPRRTTTSLTRLWEPQIFHSVVFLLSCNGWVVNSTYVGNNSWFLGTMYEIFMHAVKTYGGSRGIAPFILHLNTRCNQVVTVMTCRFTAGERTPSTNWIWGWVGPLNLSWCFAIRGSSLASGKNRTSDRPVHSLCTILTGVPASYFCGCHIWHQWEFPCITTYTPTASLLFF